MDSSPSICIPLVSDELPKSIFYNIFKKLQLGNLERIDVVRKESFNTVFVHFRQWYNTKKARNCRNKLMNGENLFVASFEKPIFWKCVLSKSLKPKN